jgi:hypothetical protein
MVNVDGGVSATMKCRPESEVSATEDQNNIENSQDHQYKCAMLGHFCIVHDHRCVPTDFERERVIIINCK